MSLFYNLSFPKFKKYEPFFLKWQRCASFKAKKKKIIIPQPTFMIHHFNYYHYSAKIFSLIFSAAKHY